MLRCLVRIRGIVLVAVAHRAAESRRDDLAAKVNRLVAEPGAVRSRRPLEGRLPHKRQIELRLESLVLNETDVLELRAREALRRRQRHADERPVRPRTEGRELERNALAGTRHVESDFDLSRALGAKRRVANLRHSDARLSVVAGDRIPRTDGVESSRSLARLTHGRAELRRRQPAGGPEALFGEDIGRADLWIFLKTEVFAERGVSVHTQTAGHEQSVAPPEHFLEENAGVDDPRTGVATERDARRRFKRGIARA